MIVRDDLLHDAEKISGLDDFGDVPFREALDVLVDSFNYDARFEGVVEDRAVEMLTGVLVKRLRLVEDRKQHPAIAEEVITAPVFIVGQPRGFDAPARAARLRRGRPGSAVLGAVGTVAAAGAGDLRH